MSSPIFVDSSGRRGRWIRRVFWALGIVVSAYLAVVFLALIGPPSLSQLAVPGLGPLLPGPGAPGLQTATGHHGKPAAVLPPRPSVRPSVGPGSAGSPSPFAPATSVPTAQPTSRPSTTAAPTPRATGAPTTAPTGPPSASPGPRSSQTPPGQASSRPSPRSSHARGSSPQPSPTP